MAKDEFEAAIDTAGAAARGTMPVTPSDDAPLRLLPKAIYVGTGGDLVMRGPKDEAAATWRNVPDGALIPFRPAQIMATGTTAADMLALY